MSFDVCRACRYVGYCTFPRNGRVVTECDEFEDADRAQSTHDWQLQDLLKLWPQHEERSEAK